MVGGILGVVLAPIMVNIKYLTGWAVVPEPSWIALMRPLLDPVMTSTTPVRLWVIFGTVYSVALVLMFCGLVALSREIKQRTDRSSLAGLWVLMAGMALVIAGDTVHTATWHQNGLTIPTPGTNPVANTGYAVHMMGMNIVLVGAVMTGISGLRRKILAASVSWLFIAIAPAAVIVSLTVLPTSPSGGLWLYSVLMIVVGRRVAESRDLVMC